MWSTQIQTDSWVNIGGGEQPDHWVRLSRIIRIYGTKGAENATVITSDGDKLASSYSVPALMKVIADTNKHD